MDWNDIDEFDEAPRSPAEKAADAEHARMERKGDRLQARLSREGLSDEDFDRILEEEFDRLDEEADAAEKRLSPWEALERQAWVEEMNEIAAAACEEVLRGEAEEPEDHPLADACSDLGIRLLHEIRDRAWLPEGATPEHAMHEIPWGVITAGTKLAGALNGRGRGEPWPPPAFLAGDPLVRLKKARGYLCDSLRGLDCADAEKLGTPDWRRQCRLDVETILAAVLGLIRDLRAVLEEATDGEDF